MRQTELRRFLIRLAAVASPIPLAATACGGTVQDAEHSNDVGGGAAGASVQGKGGYPVFVGVAPSGGAGGMPVFTGNAGGPPVFLGFADAAAPAAGGYPVYLGAGGAPAAGGFTSGSCIPTYVPWDGMDAGDPMATCSMCRADSTIVVGFSCERVVQNGEPYVKCNPMCLGGRRPEGLADRAAPVADELRTYFQEMSRLEAASIPAFRTLARELGVHGAPRALRRAARRAARDEIRHARFGKVLAERFGGAYQRPRIAPRPLRSVEEIALDNATEGCVRETFGAMIATWQSRAAADPLVRRIMRRVATDETRHAALALRVAEWAERRLDPEARERVRAARRQAAEAVMRELEWEPSTALASVAGVPRGAEARGLAAALHERLWA